MIAIHGGCGVFTEDVERILSSVIKESKDDLVKAVMLLEVNPSFNCGVGSNLTASGRVECEAAYMTSENLAFGAVAGVSNCKNPLFAANSLVIPYKKMIDETDLIPPMVLVGRGAEEYCRGIGADMVTDNDELCTQKSRILHRKIQKIMTPLEDGPLDTVGGVMIHPDGVAEACVSSGGLVYKRDGRMGHCTQFGAGIWAERHDDISAAVSMSGCGEAILRVHFAEELVAYLLDEYTTKRNVKEEDGIVLVSKVRQFLLDRVLKSERLKSFPDNRRLFGGMLMLRTADCTELVVFHNAKNFVFAYFDGISVKRHRSQLGSDQTDVVCESFLLA